MARFLRSIAVCRALAALALPLLAQGQEFPSKPIGLERDVVPRIAGWILQ